MNKGKKIKSLCEDVRRKRSLLVPQTLIDEKFLRQVGFLDRDMNILRNFVLT